MPRGRKPRPVSVAVFQSEGRCVGFVTVGTRPDGKPDRRKRSGKTCPACIGRNDPSRHADAGPRSRKRSANWRTNSPLARSLTQEQAHRVIEVIDKRRNGLRWKIGLAIGPRQGEALGLLWDQVDLDQGTVDIAWQVQRRK